MVWIPESRNKLCKPKQILLIHNRVPVCCNLPFCILAESTHLLLSKTKQEKTDLVTSPKDGLGVISTFKELQSIGASHWIGPHAL